jgi:uncharacterized membrane-anchored protein
MKNILSNPYGRDFIRVGLFFILMISVKYLYKPLDNSFVNGCIQGSIVGFIVLLIRFYIKKPKTEI